MTRHKLSHLAPNQMCAFQLIIHSAGGQAAKLLYDGYKLIDTGLDIVRVALRVGRFATGAARVAWTGLATVAGGLSIAGVVFDVVAIPFDLFVIVKGSIDIHKHRTGRGTNSNRACQLKEMIEKLEKHRDNILQLKEMFGPEISSTL